MKKTITLITLLLILAAGCSSSPSAAPTDPPKPAPNILHPLGKVPVFDHIILIVLENKGYSKIKDSSQMPFLNGTAQKNALLTRYYAVSHPSLPNYIALIGGDTFNITSDCTDCFINQPSLPDLIEKSGRTWKTYQEDMPAPCTLGNHGSYVQKHNPFMYFDPIRTNAQRCKANVVPFTQMEADLKAGSFPNFAFVMPNLCHSGHDCGLNTVDNWLKSTLGTLQKAPALEKNSLIIITFDEGDSGDSTACCGLQSTGGQVFTVLVSPMIQPGFQDATPLDHYSLLKTVMASWGLPDLGFTSNPMTVPITEPWKK